MNRLSLEELKSKKSVVKKLEAVKGGALENCHVPPTNTGAPGGGGASADPLKP